MKRLQYLSVAITTLLIGYFSRQNTEGGTFIHDYLGDALWAAMIYWGFRFLWHKQSMKFSFMATLIFAFGIEISQLYQADWINAIRHNKLGGLILGFGFLWSDLVMYFLGITFAFVLDQTYHRFFCSKNKKITIN